MTFTLQQTCQSHLSHWTPSTSQMSRTGPTTTASTEAYTRSNAGTRLGWITGNHHRASLCWACTTNSTRGRASRPPHRPDKSSIRIWCWVQRSGRGSNGSAEGASDQKGSQSLGARSAMALNALTTTRTNSCLHQIQSEGRNWLAEVGLHWAESWWWGRQRFLTGNAEFWEAGHATTTRAAIPASWSQRLG